MCVKEAYYINYHRHMATLNKRTEIFSMCRHRNMEALSNVWRQNFFTYFFKWFHHFRIKTFKSLQPVQWHRFRYLNTTEPASPVEYSIPVQGQHEKMLWFSLSIKLFGWLMSSWVNIKGFKTYIACQSCQFVNLVIANKRKLKFFDANKNRFEEQASSIKSLGYIYTNFVESLIQILVLITESVIFRSKLNIVGTFLNS